MKKQYNRGIQNLADESYKASLPRKLMTQQLENLLLNKLMPEPTDNEKFGTPGFIDVNVYMGRRYGKSAINSFSQELGRLDNVRFIENAYVMDTTLDGSSKACL